MTLPILFQLIFVVTEMIVIGLAAPGRSMLEALRDRKLLTKTLVLNIIVVPGLALLLVRILPLSTDAAVALLILAAAPGGVSAIQFTSKVEGELEFASASLFLLAVVSIVITPFLAVVVGRAALGSANMYGLPYHKIVVAMALFLVIPVAAGSAVRRAAPAVSGKLVKPLSLFSTAMFIVATILSMAVKREAIGTIGGTGVAAMYIFVLVSMGLGWLMGGPGRGKRKVLTTTTSIRFVALCLLIAITLFPERNLTVVIQAYVYVVLLPNLAFTLFNSISGKIRGKRRKT
jgi:BASS family bile acid:Na+ symporter